MTVTLEGTKKAQSETDLPEQPNAALATLTARGVVMVMEFEEKVEVRREVLEEKLTSTVQGGQSVPYAKETKILF